MPEADLTPTPLPPAPLEEPRPALTPDRWLSHDAPALVAILTRLRRRAARLLFLREFLLGAAIAAGLVFVGVALVAFKQSWGRPVGWGAAGLVVLAAVVRGWLQAARVRSDDVAAARALGTVSPEYASDLVSAVELAHAALNPAEGVSPSLVRAHLTRMGNIAARLDPRPAVRGTPVLIGFAILVAALLLHVLAYVFGGQRLHDAYAFLAFRPMAENAQLFAADPIAGDVTLTYRYPAYMNRPPRTVPGTAGDIIAPKGTVVDINARADRDVQRAFAVVIVPGKEPQVTPLQVQGRVLTGQLIVAEPGEWRFRYAKANGSTVAEGPGRPISIEPDAFPEVKITAPEAEIEVNGNESLTVSFNASDDYGLSEVDLVWSSGKGSPEQRKPIFTYKDFPRHQRGETTWSLSSLALQPGDRITYRLEAFDNDSVAGRKKGVSASQVLKVFSETEHHQEILKKAQEQWERLVSGLGDRLEEPSAGPRGEGVSKEWADKTQPKDEILASVARDMRGLAKTLSDDPRAPPEIGRALSHVGSRVGNKVDETTTNRNALIHNASSFTAQEFLAALKGEVTEEEKGVLYLEDLMDRRRLLDLAEMSRELQKGRQELAKLVDQYKKSPDEQTKQQIMGQVARLKERLYDLFKRMQELSKEIQDEHLNGEAQQQMQEGEDLMSQLDRIQQDLSKGNSDDALKELEKLQANLEKMEKQFNEHAGEADEEQKKMGEELQKLASDLMDVQAEQQAVKKATEDVQQKSRDAAQQKLKQMGADFVQKERERLKKAKEEMAGVDPQLAQQFAEDETMQKVQDHLDQLDKALQSGDFDEALEQAEQAVLFDRDLQMRLSDERDMAQRYPGFVSDPQKLDQSAQHAQRAGKPLQDIAEDLEKALRKARPPPTEAERQQMQDLAKRQGQLQRQTEQLQQKMDQLGKQMPIFGPGQEKLLQEAANQMGDAQGQLQETDPRGASARQSEALKKLQALKDAMQKAGQDSQSGGGGVPMPFASTGEGEGEGGEDGQQMRAEKVEIPSADQSKAPDEFRKDILNAMKEEAPERYKQRVRDYYEELVK